MANSLSAFLAQNAKKVNNSHFVPSERFIGEDGKPVAWEIQCITASENSALRRECTRQVQVVGKKNQYTEQFDAHAYLAKVSVRCTVFPNLHDSELQQSYGVNGAENLITTMLTPAEFEDYSTAVLKVNGFKTDAELLEEAKNS